MFIKNCSLSTIYFGLILCSVSINGMYKGVQITEPYTAGDTIQYPRLGAGSSIVLAERLPDINQQYPYGLDSAIAAGFISYAPTSYNTSVYNKAVASHHLIDSLLTNPIQVLEKNNSLKKKFCSLITSQQNNQMVEQYEKVCPIFFLTECASPCPIGRKENPHLRATFEKRVSALLVEKIETNATKTIEYVIFASGSLFSELIVVLQTLIQKPNANINVHLIDSSNCHNCSSSMCLSKMERDQFMKLLQYTFPNATLSSSMYSSTHDYLQNNINITSIDVVSAADFMDTIGWSRRSHRDYVALCLAALKKNPLASNLWLDRGNEEHSVVLTTISSEKLNDNSVEIASEHTIFGYVTDEQL